MPARLVRTSMYFALHLLCVPSAAFPINDDARQRAWRFFNARRSPPAPPALDTSATRGCVPTTNLIVSDQGRSPRVRIFFARSVCMASCPLDAGQASIVTGMLLLCSWPDATLTQSRARFQFFKRRPSKNPPCSPTTCVCFRARFEICFFRVFLFFVGADLPRGRVGGAPAPQAVQGSVVALPREVTPPPSRPPPSPQSVCCFQVLQSTSSSVCGSIPPNPRPVPHNSSHDSVRSRHPSLSPVAFRLERSATPPSTELRHHFPQFNAALFRSQSI